MHGPGGHHRGPGGPGFGGHHHRPPMGGWHHRPPMGGGWHRRPPYHGGCCGCLLPVIGLLAVLVAMVFLIF